MTFLFYSLYNLLLILATPFLWLASYFNDKLGSSFSGQKDIKTTLHSFNKKVKLDPKPVVWLHAASAGEFEQIRPFLSRLKKMDIHIFQTFSSPTIFYKVSHSEIFDGVSFLPWDFYPRVNRFIRELKPQLFINTRHDIWPNLLLALRRNGVRNILVNGNLYHDSIRLRPIVKNLNQSVFKFIDHIYTGSTELESLFKNLYSGSINVVGDSRFDQVAERARQNTQTLLDKPLIADRRVIVYGSVVDSDLDVVCSAITKTLRDANMLHVIVPHEVRERNLIPWESELYRNKIKSIRISEIEHFEGESVLIWNAVGQLADLYKHADLAYIGAGFTTGVHSVTEAAIYQTPSAHGPKFSILAEAIELVELELSTVVNTDNELVAFLRLESQTISQLSDKIAVFIQERLGATDRIIEQEFPLQT